MTSTLLHPRIVTAFALLLVGAGLSITAWQGPDDAMLVPRFVLTIWCATALMVLIGELIRRAPVAKAQRSPLPLLMAAVLIAAIATASLGFLIPALPLVALTLWLFRVRQPLWLVLGTLILGGGLWFLFHHVLLIRLPTLLASGLI
ncbi:Tripartite tricarboxylate transporter TctB family protein [Kushneria avicenniae]|uniref:Tripartite tricarboxylate transporter TctB family protein n=1 Tax=Kushneria avicenniae TaxID=402385 RepID=A0A1I1MS99_9GAMM|nr:tripartite tricarboxylate transporter TctB family protein [Kushneria avicenniae]SFC88324.1 Tripartite tricarboxylate transporter TctB family protein [Kushneria avicenniae]